MDGFIDELDIISKWMNVWIDKWDAISKMNGWSDWITFQNGWMVGLDTISKWMDGWIGYHFKAGQ